MEVVSFSTFEDLTKVHLTCSGDLRVRDLRKCISEMFGPSLWIPGEPSANAYVARSGIEKVFVNASVQPKLVMSRSERKGGAEVVVVVAYSPAVASKLRTDPLEADSLAKYGSASPTGKKGVLELPLGAKAPIGCVLSATDIGIISANAESSRFLPMPSSLEGKCTEGRELLRQMLLANPKLWGEWHGQAVGVRADKSVCVVHRYWREELHGCDFDFVPDLYAFRKPLPPPQRPIGCVLSATDIAIISANAAESSRFLPMPSSPEASSVEGKYAEGRELLRQMLLAKPELWGEWHGQAVGVRLADKSVCVVPWNRRKELSGCDFDFVPDLCAFQKPRPPPQREHVPIGRVLSATDIAIISANAAESSRFLPMPSSPEASSLEGKYAEGRELLRQMLLAKPELWGEWHGQAVGVRLADKSVCVVPWNRRKELSGCDFDFIPDRPPFKFRRVTLTPFYDLRVPVELAILRKDRTYTTTAAATMTIAAPAAAGRGKRQSSQPSSTKRAKIPKVGVPPTLGCIHSGAAPGRQCAGCDELCEWVSS